MFSYSISGNCKAIKFLPDAGREKWGLTKDMKKKGNEKKSRKIFRACVVCMLLLYCLSGVCKWSVPKAYAGSVHFVLKEEGAEEETIREPKESELYAKSAVLMDADSGRILFAKNEKEVLPMASTTKIMTLLIALEEGNLEDVVTVSSYAASMPDVQLNMRTGEQYRLEDLLYSLMLESHNDSAVAIAETVAGSVEEFAVKMNHKAEEIGCKNTTFITPNGLDAEAVLTKADGTQQAITHSTTAEDLALILSYCITKSEQKEEFLKITQTPSYTFCDLSGKRTFSCRNHNALLYSMEGALSGKTGFTGKAGYCYVGAVKRDDRTLVAALLACGWPNNKTYKWKDTAKLMEYGFSQFESAFLENESGQIPMSGKILVENGCSNALESEAYTTWKREGIHKKILLRKDEKIKTDVKIKKVLEAPVKEGECVGSITYKINGESVGEEKIILQSTVEKIDYDWCLKMTVQRFLLSAG